MRSSEFCENIYFVVDGDLELVMKYDNEDHILERLHRLSNFGTFGVLKRHPFGFLVRAKTNTTVQMLSKASIECNS